jgi:2'-5' RNA ligase
MLLSPVGTAESESTDEPNPMTRLLLEQCTSTGILDGVSIPTLSLIAQQLFHLGYPRRPEEPHAEDVIRLISMGQDGWINPLGQNGTPLSSKESRKPSTLLLIPIFAFPPDLWKLCRLYHNNLHVPPHVTLAIPFQPLESVTAEVVQQLTRFFEETLAFDFELNHVRWFGTNVVYLEPSNAESFRSITEQLQRMFPDFHPYDGVFESVIPHVTLSEHGTLADRRIMGRQAPKYTPISARASHVWLMSNERERDEWAIVKVFHLGPPPLARSYDRGSQAT